MGTAGEKSPHAQPKPGQGDGAPLESSLLRRYLQAIRTDPENVAACRNYLPLRLIPQSLDRKSKDALLETGLSELDMLGALANQATVELIDALRASPRLMILGDPGSGKTTILRRLAHDHAEYCLAHPNSVPTPEMIVFEKRIPVYIPLNLFVEGKVEDLILSQLQNYRLQDAASLTLRAVLKEENLLFLIDGLSEIPAHYQLEGATLLARFLDKKYPHQKYVITCRLQDAPTLRAIFGATKSFLIGPLSDPDIERYLVKYHGPDLGQSLARDIAADTRIWELGRNPLALCKIAEVAIDGAGLQATTRSRILNVIARRLSEWSDAKVPDEDRVDGALRDEALAQLALSMHEQEMLCLERSECQRIIKEIAATRYQGKALSWTVRQTMDSLTQSGILRLSRDWESIEFAHELLREFYAALALKAQMEHDEDISGYINNETRRQRWTGPIVLLYGLLEDPSRLITLLIGDGESHPRIALAARCVVENEPKERQAQALKLESSNANTYLYLGLALKEMGYYDDAADALARAVAMRPDRADFHNELGTVYSLKGDFTQALNEYREAVRLEPSEPTYRRNAGVLYGQLQQPEEATAELEQAVALLRQSSADAHEQLGLIYERRIMFDEALQQYKSAVELVPGEPNYHYRLATVAKRLGRYEPAIEALRQVVTLKPNYAAAHAELGAIYELQSWFSEALTEHRTAAELEPGKASHHHAVATMLKRLGRLNEALAMLERALELDRNFHEALNELGNVYMLLTQQEEAARAYRRAVELAPQEAAYHRNLGAAYSSLRRYSEAAMEVEEALRIRPDHTPWHAELGDVYTCQNRREEALREYLLAASMEPQEVSYHTKAGAAYRELGKHDEALAELRKALEIAPNRSDVHNELGQLYEAQGKYEEALREYRYSVELAPDEAVYRRNVGVAYRKLDRHDEEIEELQRAASLKPEYGDVYNELGNVYERQGLFQQALEQYQHAVQ
ncbi:MAG: tetratricopeptide repeat protein, partial [Chloroflexi bacterium]|nr:tetratricopeptide repeat protein [Chloroflexota bacterium]